MLRLLLLLLAFLPPTASFLPCPLRLSPSSLPAKPPKPTSPTPNDAFRSPARAPRPPLGHVIPKSSRRQHSTGRSSGSTGGRRLGVMAQGESRAPDLQNVSKLRVLSGAARGRLLLSPAVYLRPMMGKVKAAVFSTLRSFGLYAPGFGPVKYLDVFSGSGSVGLESLSRSHAACGGGVSHFVDLAPECVSTVEANLERLQLEGGTAILADARKALLDPPPAADVGSAGRPYDVVSLTPPYEEVVYEELMSAVSLSPAVGPGTLVVVEYPVELGCLPHVFKAEGGRALLGVRNRKYGRTVIAIYRVEGDMGRLVGCESSPEEFISL